MPAPIAMPARMYGQTLPTISRTLAKPRVDAFAEAVSGPARHGGVDARHVAHPVLEIGSIRSRPITQPATIATVNPSPR